MVLGLSVARLSAAFAASLALLLASAPGASAQPVRPHGSAIHFQRLDARDGLSSSVATGGIVQDTLGFVWIGTNDGLNRYDGTDFETFRPTPFDTTTLRDAGITDLALTPDGTLWVATLDGGLHRYDARREHFAHVAEVGDDTERLSVGPSGALWVPTRLDGVFRVDPAGGVRTYRPFGEAAASLRNGARATLEARDGALWIATNYDGVVRIPPGAEAGDFVPIPYERGDTNAAAHSSALVQRADGSIWVGTPSGLFRYDEAADTLRAVSQWREAGGGEVGALLEDPGGSLWIGSDDGLYRLMPTPGGPDRLSAYRHDSSDAASLPSGRVSSLYLSRDGLVWVGGSGGVSTFLWHAPPVERLDPLPPISYNSLWALVASPDGTLWIASENGLARSWPGGGPEPFPLRLAPGAEPLARVAYEGVVGLHEDRAGRLWIGLPERGLFVVDRATGVLDRHLAWTHEQEGEGLYVTSPWSFAEDAAGRLWVLSGPGIGCLTRYDPAAGTAQRYCHDDDDPTSPTDDMAHDLAVQPDGTVWIATWGSGLDHIDPERGLLRSLRHDPTDLATPASDFICAMRQGPDGALWLAYYGFGFSRFDPATGAFTHYHSGNSALPNDVVYALEWDARGALWLSTNAGLTRFRPADASFLTLGSTGGAQVSGYLEVSSAASARGPLYFGGMAGVDAVYPSRVNASGAPPVVLTRILASGQPLVPAPGALLDVAAPLARSLALPPERRDVAFRFAALRYGGGQAPRYRYRMEGYDTTWSHTTGLAAAAFTNLAPGTYTFRAQAMDGTGAWGEGAALGLTVAPFFYETRWFYALSLLALAAMLGVGYQVRLRQARRREAALERTVQERTAELREEKRKTEAQAERLVELDHAKSRFFTDVSHEFRTPLTLTLGPLEDLERDPDLSAASRRYVDLALRNSRRLLRLIGQLLDVAKLDAGALRLHAEPVDLAAFARDCAAPFEPFAERRQIRFDVVVPAAPVWAEVDAEKLEQVVVNLLSNAFKFTPEGGAIRLALSAENVAARVPGTGAEAPSRRAILTIRDTGPGVAPDHLPHLFERFYQSGTAASDVQAGSGIGLSLARDLAELHGGTLVAESTPGFGATFTLTLPARASEAPRSVSHQPLRSAARSHCEDTASQHCGSLPDTPDASETDPQDEAEARPTVLVVDDHADIRAYVRDHLAERYAVLEAADGEEALALVREGPPDLIVSDVMMPRLDGFALVRALKSDATTDFIPVLLLTAKATAEEKLEGLGLGADDYLTKPFDARELAARLGNLLAAQHRLKQHLAARAIPATDAEAPRAADPRAETHDAEDRAFLHRVDRSVAAGLGDETYSVQVLAADLKQSRSSVHRRMRALLAETPSAYIRRARLRRAAELLAAREGSVGEVAYAVGFKSVSHFSSAFRDEFGHSPTAYLARTPLPEP